MRTVPIEAASWDEIRRRFRWRVPRYFNIAAACCDRHAADRSRLALCYENEQGERQQYTFWDVRRRANQLANVLTAIGVRRGDRVGIVMPQQPETAITHMGVYKIGGIAVPLAEVFQEDALRYRLSNSGAKAVVVDAANLHKIQAIRADLGDLEHVLLVGGTPERGEIDFDRALDAASHRFETLRTRADDPALIIYTSGTTGNPKGALHAHRVLLGHLPGFELSHDFFPQRGDLSWTPADWAWIGGLLDLLLPSWYHGVPVVAHRARKFDPERVLRLMATHGVRNVFMPPTALRLLRQVPDIRGRFDVDLRTIMSGGEPLGAEVLAWGRETFGVTINEIYGQTEVNYVVGNCARVMEVRPGSMGKPYPGHDVEVIDDDGNPLPTGEVGEFAFRRADDPVFFLGYFNDPEGTAGKFKGEWACSGDTGYQDADGYLWFRGRKDDVIGSAGYRIGPTEVEESLIKHPAVALAAVVGSPDELRGAIVKAFVKLAPGYTPSESLAAELQQFVKSRLAAHEYPREVEFVADLPMTTTGKIRRRDLRLLEEQRKGKLP
jgi:acetyl-CoA synthetase